MFINRSDRILPTPHSSITVLPSDIDDDGALKTVIAGYGYPGTVLKWVNNGLVNITPPALADYIGRRSVWRRRMWMGMVTKNCTS
ncbi:MAG: hypothetical protein U0452_06930 [Anaerolineae bacterium]